MDHDNQDVRDAVRKRYARAATSAESCCGSRCGCGDDAELATATATAIGYDAQALKDLPTDANLGLGCGNPTAIASLRPGQVVLDLGSGAGIDCFLAAKEVGASGKVIGVDMTPEMIAKARGNAAKGGYGNVEFRLGEIEALPVADASVDVVISNCVLNLSPEKGRVLAEVWRVLKPGGRVVVSDLVSDVPVPSVLSGSLEIVAACLPTARDRYLQDFRAAGFADVRITSERKYPTAFILEDSGVVSYLAKNPQVAGEMTAFADAIFGAHFEATRS